jgi:hypothetical protein
MRVSEILNEMSSIVKKTKLSQESSPWINTGSGKLGPVLYLSGETYLFPNRDNNNDDRYKFDSIEELQQSIDWFNNTSSGAGGHIIWTNPAGKNTARAFAVTNVHNEKGDRFWIGKYMTNTKREYTGSSYHNDDSMSTFDTSVMQNLGYVLSDGRTLRNRGQEHLDKPSKNALKTNKWDEYNKFISDPNQNTTTPKSENSNLEPSSVLNPLTDLSLTDIVNQVTNKFANVNQSLIDITNIIASGKAGPYLLPEGIGKNAFTVQFCEILQPMALVSGAVKINNKDLVNSTISYNSSKIGKLGDSVINNSNEKIIVSSKKETGSASSLDGLNQYVNRLSPEEKNQYKTELELLKYLTEVKDPIPTQLGPLKVAVYFNLLSPSDATFISNLDHLEPAKYLARNNKQKTLPDNASDNIKELLIKSGDPDRSGPSPYHQILKYLMNQIASLLNNDNKFQSLLNLLLEKGNVILMSTIVKGNQFNFEHKTQAKLNAMAYNKNYVNGMLGFSA